MKNVTTAGEGEEKTYMKPNIYIRMYLNHFAGEHIAHAFPSNNQLSNHLKKSTLFECQGTLVVYLARKY